VSGTDTVVELRYMLPMELQYHIGLSAEHLAGNHGKGRYVLLPGDRSRAARIAERFEDCQHIPNPRGHDSYLGRIFGTDGQSIDVLAISSGMGPPSVEIVATELIACGARRLVRVGSSASMNPCISPGDVLVVTGAVRDESTSDRWTPPAFPAVSHHAAVAAMVQGAVQVGLSDRTYTGLCHSKDSLYGREFGKGPFADENRTFVQALHAAGVCATEMEASTLFVLASVASAAVVPSVGQGFASVPVQAACVLAIYGDVGSEETRLADQRAISVACAGVCEWAAVDAAGS